MYDIDNGKPIINRSAEETNMDFCISHPVIFEKKVNEKMSIVTVMYKPGLVIVGADRRVNLVSTTQTSMQTNHIKVKYIEKFNAILSAVGSLKYKDIWWDEYCEPMIEKCSRTSDFIESLELRLNQDDYPLEIQITDHNNGMPEAYAYDVNKRRIINRSYDERNNYLSDRIYYYGLTSLANYIDFKSPPSFSDRDHLENYIKHFISSVIKIDEFSTKELSLFQSTKPALAGYPIDIISLDGSGVNTITVNSPYDL